MRQVEVRNPNAGECVEHPECFVEIWHPLSPCTSSLLLKSHSRKECRDDSERSEVMQAEREGEPLMPPPCFIGLVKEGCPFLGKRKPWMGLSFQVRGFGRVIGNGFGVRDVK